VAPTQPIKTGAAEKDRRQHLNANDPTPLTVFGSTYIESLWKACRGAVILCDRDGIPVVANNAFHREFQFGSQLPKDRCIDEIITPTPFMPEAECIREMVKNGAPVALTTIRKRLDGNLIKIFLTSSLVSTETSCSLILLIFKPVADFTSKRSSDRLDSGKLLMEAFENSCEPSILTDYEGGILQTNVAFSAEFGDAAGNVADRLIPEEILPEADYINAMVRRGRTVRVNTARIGKNGDSIGVSLLCAPFDEGRMCRMYTTTGSTALSFDDIRRRNRYRHCPNPGSSPGMMFHCGIDPSRSMEFISPGTAAFTGYTEEALMNGGESFGSLIHELDRDMVQRTIEDSFHRGSEYSITYRMTKRNGDVLWVMEQGHAHRFAEGDESQGFCEGCIVDITKTDVHETPDLTRSRIEKLHSIAGELQRSRSAGDIYRICTEAGLSILDGACSCIFLCSDDNTKLVASSGKEDFSCEAGCRLGMADVALGTSGPCFFRARDMAEGFCPAGTSGVCFRLGEKAVFQLISGSGQMFGEDDTRILELLLGYTQQGLKRIALQHQLISQALHDPLTGIYNRNYFNRLIQLEEHRARRLDSSIGFIMVDIDNFKHINDNFGHQAGDSVLRRVAAILEDALRNTDTVLRYGGDEFLIILTRMNNDHTHKVEERIRLALASSEGLPEISGERISVSMGHAFWSPEGEDSIDDTLRAADLAMLDNKKNKARLKYNG
jgi:diguanylate cyclase (GGDEF)-like protein/PAS domain S-box-containing protein